MTNSEQTTESDPVDGMITREIRICADCYELIGHMCHTPGCVFCRRTISEVGDMLDALQIRPVIDGVRYRL